MPARHWRVGTVVPVGVWLSAAIPVVGGVRLAVQVPQPTKGTFGERLGITQHRGNSSVCYRERVHPAMPVPRRPLNALDICDGAFALVRSRPRSVVAIAAAFVLPSQVLAAWVSRSLFTDFDLGSFDSTTGEFEGQSNFNTFGMFQGSWFSTLLQYLILPFLGVALTHLVAGWRAGTDRSAKECLLFTLRKAHIIAAAFVLGKLLQLVSLLILTPMVLLVAPVIAAEGHGPIAAIKRSFNLGKRRYWQLVPLLFLVMLVNVLLTYPLLTLPTIGGFLLGEWGWVVFFALGSVGTTALNLLAVGAAVFAYFDTIDRTEGADLARRIGLARAARV